MSDKTSNNQHGLEEDRGEDTRIREKESEILLLHKQLEILKQELYCECELAQVYVRELNRTGRELGQIKNELSNVLALQRLGLNQAKELAKSIVQSNTSVSESLAHLLGAIYNSTVNPGELARTEKPSLTIKPALGFDRLRTVITLKIPSGLKTKLERYKVSCVASIEQITLPNRTRRLKGYP